MKSWGARIVERLFKSKSHKDDAAGDETPPVISPAKASPLHSDQLPDEGLQVNGLGESPDQTGPVAIEEVETKTANKNAELNGDELHKLEKPSPDDVQPANEAKDKSATSLSNPASKRKQILARDSKSKDGQGTGEGKNVRDEQADDEASSGESATISNERRFNKDIPKSGNRKISTNKLADAQSQEFNQDGPESRSDELAPLKETLTAQKPLDAGSLSKRKQSTATHSTDSGATALPLKSSRKQKLKVEDERVTDEELAELEAENARLKLLLHKKM